MFVRACSILCSRIVRKADLEAAHLYIKQFLLKFIDVYGHEHFTPNMHMHMHLYDCCQDYGSVYAFWCFAYERCNGILGSYQTNKKNIEAQIMKKFLLQQQVGKLSFPADFRELSSLFNSFNIAKGSLKAEFPNPAAVVQLDTLIHSNLETIQTTCNYVCFSVDKETDLLPKVYEKVLSSTQVECIKQLFSLLYPNFYIKHFSLFYEESSSAVLLGETRNSVNSRTNKNSIYLINWLINPESLNFAKRICQINYYLKHSITLSLKDSDTIYKCVHILCHVSWFKPHEKHDWFGHSAIVYKTDFEQESYLNFIPIQRLISVCAFGHIPVKFDSENTETVLIAIPLPSQLCI